MGYLTIFEGYNWQSFAKKDKIMKKLTKAKKEKIKYFLIIAGAASAVSLLVLVIFVMVIQRVPTKTVKKEKKDSLDYSLIEVEKPNISKKLLTKNINSRPGTPLEDIKGIVVHYTANPGTNAKANRNYFESRKDCPDEGQYKVSSHFIIGLQGSIIQCIPENEIAYASNNRNSDTISIECCHPDDSGKFTDETYRSLIRLVSYLCDKYEIPVNQIIRHYDVTQKECPRYFVNHPEEWEKFHSDVTAYLKKKMKKQ